MGRSECSPPTVGIDTQRSGDTHGRRRWSLAPQLWPAVLVAVLLVSTDVVVTISPRSRFPDPSCLRCCGATGSSTILKNEPSLRQRRLQFFPR
jgi:hypothetical protein